MASILPDRKYRNKDWLYQQYIDEKRNITQLGRLCAVDRTTIWLWLKKFNIPRRTSSEARKNYIPWNKNKCNVYSNEVIEKMRKKMLGKKGELSIAWNGGEVEVECIICRKKFYVKKSRAKRYRVKYCSHKCKGLDMRETYKGENSPSWKGGITPENKKIRSSRAFKDWREQIFKRDDYTCLICKTRGGTLCPHHILPFAVYPKYRFDVDNGLTMCKKDHYILHNKHMWLGIYNSAFGL